MASTDELSHSHLVPPPPNTPTLSKSKEVIPSTMKSTDMLQFCDMTRAESVLYSSESEIGNSQLNITPGILDSQAVGSPPDNNTMADADMEMIHPMDLAIVGGSHQLLDPARVSVRRRSSSIGAQPRLDLANLHQNLSQHLAWQHQHLPTLNMSMSISTIPSQGDTVDPSSTDSSAAIPQSSNFSSQGAAQRNHSPSSLLAAWNPPKPSSKPPKDTKKRSRLTADLTSSTDLSDVLPVASSTTLDEHSSTHSSPPANTHPLINRRPRHVKKSRK